MSQKTLLLLNRKSAARPDVREVLKSIQKDLDIEVWVPWSRKQLRKILRRAVKGGTKRVIAAGGDGTLNKVTNALLSCSAGVEVSLGLVPLGTANDFARAYGDFGRKLGHSIRIAATGEASPIDVGRINGTHFVNVASGGFGAMITATTPQEVKRRLGGLAYTLSGLVRISELQPAHASISIDGRPAVPTAVTALVIANSRYAGGGFDVAPAASVSDGLLDLGLLSTESLQTVSTGFAGFLESKDPASTIVNRSQVKSAVLKTEKPFHLNLDGEPMVETKFEIDVLPGRLLFVAPAPN
ncbi:MULTISPECIES: YegS/Rv2252/BmrU family lipid kinase [Halocynthiibacter]|uniref:YegS/Rv2252/BmrU family lipid kinase n=1 Tax=Halocynthiibacter halioticoli TaxID=2986804 RepID=A0AAE3LSK7_9RHOB|nr:MULTISPECIES: YegS/Rv2252/BmrU family lipid kinase [Halocynthiibacter]MCV6825928.1 YegS/Rv2252/BmrU family lipid kinase [Halocynthiibacter halioticoli]MCW4058929.1 YegS/Rv2252/BmrU family lipid kinase [Halocynthiibacter sp. SDUM655004]